MLIVSNKCCRFSSSECTAFWAWKSTTLIWHN